MMTLESAAAYWRERLREGVLPGDCPVFDAACELLSRGDMQSFTLGDMTYRGAPGAERIRQAEALMAPWLRDDGFVFREVK